jgi:hypothetical protein
VLLQGRCHFHTIDRKSEAMLNKCSDRRRAPLIAIAVSVVFLGLAAMSENAVLADTLYSNTDCSGGGYVLQVTNPDNGDVPISWAIPFTVPASSDYAFSSASICLHSNAGTFNGWLLTDQDGLPGESISSAPLFTIDLPDSPYEDLWRTGTSGASVILQAGRTYWFAGVASAGLIGGWDGSMEGPCAISYSTNWPPTGSDWQTFFAPGSPSLVLNASPVPEPSAIVLLGIGLASLFAFRRRGLRADRT